MENNKQFKVKFETGQTVSFDRQPTPQDIDEVAQKLQISKPSQTQQQSSTTPQPNKVKGGFLGEIFSGNTQRFGKTIGGAIAAPESAGKFDESLQQFTETENKIRQRLTTADEDEKARLMGILEQHQSAKPEVEQFTGDVINKTNRQIAGEAGGTALEALGGGVLSKGISAVSKTGSVVPKIGSLAGVGAVYGGAEGLSQSLQRDEGMQDNVSSTLKGGAFGAGLGLAGGVIGKGISKSLNKNPDVDKSIGQILKPKDVRDASIAKRIGRELDANNIKTYADNTRETQKYINDLETYKDTVLARNQKQIPIKELSITRGTGENAATFNYVEEGLTQLYKQYDAVNDIVGKQRILNLARKAEREGLTRLEIEKIAREHGNVLNAFNASGKAASGVTKQSAENIRKGIKETSRSLTNNPKVKETLTKVDKQISDALRYKKLSEKMEETVRKFKNDREKMSLIARLGAKGANLVNTLLGGTPSAVLRSLLLNSGRRSTMTKLSPIELELALNRNLKLLQKINNSSDTSVIKKALDQLVENVEIPKLGGR